MSSARTSPGRSLAAHGILLLYTLIVLVPVFVVVNSFKSRRAIFVEPLALPTPATIDLVGYRTVLAQGDFLLYFQNSLIVTLASLAAVPLFGAMAAFALSEYRFRGNALMGLHLALGIMIPIRLGTVAILQFMAASGLVNTLLALILVYTAQGLPLAIFIDQFVTNWNAVLAALSLAILPVLVLYLIFSRQLVRGITAGAVK